MEGVVFVQGARVRPRAPKDEPVRPPPGDHPAQDLVDLKGHRLLLAAHRPTEFLDQHFLLERVDRHGRQVGARNLRLLNEVDDLTSGVQLADAEPAGICIARRKHHGQIGIAFVVEVKQRPIVHGVHMVGRNHQHVGGVSALDELEILIQGIGRPAIPFADGKLEIGRKKANAAARAHQVPGHARAHVIHQRCRPILRQNPHLSDSGSGQVGKGEIYTTIDAAENDGRLGAPLGQDRQLLAAPTCENHSYRFAHRVLLHLLAAATVPPGKDANRWPWSMPLQSTVSEGERDDFSGQSRPPVAQPTSTFREASASNRATASKADSGISLALLHLAQ
jgi:hypothetical protein